LKVHIMNNKAWFGASLLIASLACASSARAAEAPSVESILNKYLTAIGGRAAVEKVSSRVLKVKIHSETLPDSEGELFAKAPNKLMSQIEVAANGTMTEGFDGKVAWTKTPREGARDKTGDELAKAKRDAEFYQDLKLKALYPDLAFKGTERVAGEDVLVLEARPTPTSKERFSYGAKTGLLVRRESELLGSQGRMSVTLLAQDYRAVDGIKYPHLLRIKISLGGRTFELDWRVLEIKHGVKIEDTKFAKPSS
jgi:zinc protease